jgi:hypothetical protein
MAVDFNKRSSTLELMDLPIEHEEDLFINLKEMVRINQLNGGPAVTFKAIKALLKNHNREIHILDIGFGGGDMLHYLLNHQAELSCPIKLTGIDLMPEAKTYALQAFPDLAKNVQLEICDYKDWFARGGKADIITAGLFCHHLSDEMLIDFFKDHKKIVQFFFADYFSYLFVEFLNGLDRYFFFSLAFGSQKNPYRSFIYGIRFSKNQTFFFHAFQHPGKASGFESHQGCNLGSRCTILGIDINQYKSDSGGKIFLNGFLIIHPRNGMPSTLYVIINCLFALHRYNFIRLS